MIGKKFRLEGNQSGMAILEEKKIGRGTYADGTVCVVLKEDPETLTTRVLGTDHIVKFNRKKITAVVLEDGPCNG
jgi:hypothetical protein